MSEPLINNKIGGENQKIFLNQEYLVGVQSINISQNLGLQPLTYVGIGNKAINFLPRSEQNGTLQINRLIINNEPFFSLVTGSNLSNIYILKAKNDSTNNYILHSGYFTDYSSSYSIGNVPETSVTCIAVKDAGRIGAGDLSQDCLDDLSVIATGNFTPTGYIIPSIGTISLSIGDFSTNRLQSYSITAKSNKIPVYNCGQKHPKRIDNQFSDIECSFSFELGDYELKRLRNFPQSGVVKNLQITIKDYSNETTICSYNFSNLNLTAESYSVSSNENVLIQQTYQTKIYAD